MGRRMDAKGGIYIKYRIASDFVLMRASCFTFCSISRQHSLSPWTSGKTGIRGLDKVPSEVQLAFWYGFAVFAHNAVDGQVIWIAYVQHGQVQGRT